MKSTGCYKHKYLSFLVCISFIFSGYAQKAPEPNFLFSIRDTLFTTDHQENIYLFGENYVKKLSSRGDILFTYSNKQFGKISSVDAANPYKILIFSQDQQKVIILDNTLSPKSDVIDLQWMGYNNITAVCISFIKSFWIYDAQSGQLVLLDDQLQKVTETVNLKSFAGLYCDNPQLQETNNLLFVRCGPQLLIFDQFGVLVKKIQLPEPVDEGRSFDQVYYYLHNNNFCVYDINKLHNQCIFTVPKYDAVRIEKNSIYFLIKNKGLYKLDFKF